MARQPPPNLNCGLLHLLSQGRARHSGHKGSLERWARRRLVRGRPAARPPAAASSGLRHTVTHREASIVRAYGHLVQRRTVLVTNDDGPDSAGLCALVRAVASDRQCVVTVAVPATDVSSTGTALGAVDDIPIEAWPSRRTWPGVAVGVEVRAQPSAIVTLAVLGAFGSPPDLLLAGINHGVNIGWGLIHSSTIGAALTAAVHRVPAVAFSAPATADWPAWHPALVRLIKALPRSWPVGTVLSVNLPQQPGPDPGFVWCRPAESTATGGVARTTLPDGRLALRLSYRPHGLVTADTDAAVLAAGQVALTSLSLPFAPPVDSAWQAEMVRRLRQDRTAILGAR